MKGPCDNERSWLNFNTQNATIGRSMATLTEVSGVARKVVKFSAAALILIMLAPVAVNGIKSLYNRLNPPPPPPPTVKYGKLPALIFPVADKVATPTYKLETISGTLPKTPTTARAYVVKVNKSRLKSPDEQRKKAALLGFTNDFVELDEKTYRFVHPQQPAEMLVNIVSGGFAFRLDWTTDPAIYKSTQIPVGNAAIGEARGWLQGLSLLPQDLVAGTGKVQYFVATGSAMIPADTFYGANFTRVDLYRADKDEMKIVTSGSDTSPVSVIFSGLPGAKRIVQANYQYSATLDNEFATYPLKSVGEAWEELTSGRGYIAKRAGQNVTVRRAYLAYYEANVPQDFLQPVFVFEGDAGFVAYVPAIKSEFTVSEPAM